VSVARARYAIPPRHQSTPIRFDAFGEEHGVIELSSRFHTEHYVFAAHRLARSGAIPFPIPPPPSLFCCSEGPSVTIDVPVVVVREMDELESLCRATEVRAPPPPLSRLLTSHALLHCRHTAPPLLSPPFSRVARQLWPLAVLLLVEGWSICSLPLVPPASPHLLRSRLRFLPRRTTRSSPFLRPRSRGTQTMRRQPSPLSLTAGSRSEQIGVRER